MRREELFRETVKENSHRIFRICSYFFSDPDERNDAYQESLIRIWENLDGFRGKSKLSTWIYRVVVNNCLANIRKDKDRKAHVLVTEDLCRVEVIGSSADDETIQQDEKLAFFQQFMGEINISDRTLVSLYLEDLSTREMGEVTGISEANVRVRLHRIKEKIKKEWEEKQHGTR